MSCDAWKDTGDCSECRRARYCNKQCTANKARLNRIFKEGFADAVSLITPAYSSTDKDSAKDHHDSMDAMVYSIDALRKLAED